jgi:hypothetical protein
VFDVVLIEVDTAMFARGAGKLAGGIIRMNERLLPRIDHGMNL